MIAFLSHSTRVRGLKYLYGMAQDELCRSHSTRVRGLKYPNCEHTIAPYFVALYTSAWIEIGHGRRLYRACYWSHSTRVRGLKYPRVNVHRECFGRTLHECVD